MERLEESFVRRKVWQTHVHNLNEKCEQWNCETNVFLPSFLPALVYLSFKPWVNPQKFLWKEEALWLPSVDELINVFSLHQLEFVSFWLDYFPTYYEIWTFAKAPKQCWATRSPQLKHTDHIPQHMFVPIRYQNRPILVRLHHQCEIKVIEEQFWRFGCDPRQAVKRTAPRIWSVIVIRQKEITVIVSYQSGHLVRNERRPKASPLGLIAWVWCMTADMTMLVC